MSKIAVIGGTGHTGGHIVREAAARGHEVTSWSRSAPAEPVAGVQYATAGSTPVESVIADADAVVLALAPRGETAGRLVDLYSAYAATAAEAGTRLVVLGGFSSLRPAPGAPRFIEGELPDWLRPEAQECENVRQWLVSSAPADLDWVFVSPAGAYGAPDPEAKKTGSYRISDEIALFDAEGRSEISGPDLADAIVNEADAPQHHREHISVAY